ncbi:MAG: sigma-70 family RNA polymerase sigma factor [Planctomycetota bacterium]
MSGTSPLERTLELVQRAQKGDESALSDLLARYQERVRALVRRRMGRGLRAELESGDMVQEAMVEVLEGFSRFEMRDETAFVRWLSTLVENRLREVARFHGAAKRDRAREVHVDQARGSDDRPRAAELVDAHAATPSEDVSRRELGELVHEALAKLDERHRRVLVLRQTGAEWESVAHDMGLGSAGAARMLHARARVALMKHVPRGSDELG